MSVLPVPQAATTLARSWLRSVFTAAVMASFWWGQSSMSAVGMLSCYGDPWAMDVSVGGFP